MKLSIVKACSDLGVHIRGSELGPIKLNKFDQIVENTYIVNKKTNEKEFDKDNKKKNLNELNSFNEELYTTIINQPNDFIITVGGDHSIAIASALASKKIHKNIGIIWIDSHADFHDFSTTISGNIHGMPFATICHKNANSLTNFFDGEYFNTKNAVLVGARDVEDDEYKKLIEANVKIFTTEDIKEKGAKEIMEEAIKIASNNTEGIHISYDLDVIDPAIAPGVSVKANNGINENDAFIILDTILKHLKKIKSFDLVEFNPTNDLDGKTENIANSILEKLINKLQQ